MLAQHSDEQTISLLALSVSNLEKHPSAHRELPLRLEDEERTARHQERHGALDGRPSY